MSKTVIGGAVCREFESEALAAEMLDQLSFQMCLESGDGSRTFNNWRQRVPESWCRDTECLYNFVLISSLSQFYGLLFLT